jgi:hypothetical protein
MKKIRIEDAVGTVLAHDMTRIIPGRIKEVGFEKGHIVTPEDIPELLKIGKKYLYILELREDQIHEDDAAIRIATAISGDNVHFTKPREGKSRIVADCKGLVQINVAILKQINKIGDIIVSTLKTGSLCFKGQTIAATRIIPLVTQTAKIERLEELTRAHGPVIRTAAFRKMRFGAVVTGSEIYEGLIEDEFDKYVGQKAIGYGCEFVKKILAPDDPEAIARAIHDLKDAGCELILSTGGLSVDPDDVTKAGVRKSGAQVISYGSPVLPGAMSLYADLDGTVILGLPACVYFHLTTFFDLILPKILINETITADTIAEMGHGGLCMNCEPCRFPACGFGR